MAVINQRRNTAAVSWSIVSTLISARMNTQVGGDQEFTLKPCLAPCTQSA